MFMCIENGAFKRGRICCVYKSSQLELPTAVVLKCRNHSTINHFLKSETGKCRFYRQSPGDLNVPYLTTTSAMEQCAYGWAHVLLILEHTHENASA